MNFEEFCSNNDKINKTVEKDKFEKFNQNLQKNIKNSENLGQNDPNQQNFYKNSNLNIDEEEIKEKIQKYQNMNQNELLSELLKETKKQKQNGNLDNQKLEDIKNSMSTVLNDEQKNRLDELIKLLR